jgi:hypothetical protein
MTQTRQQEQPKEAMTDQEYAELHPDDGALELIDVTAWGWTVDDINYAAGVHDKD